MSNPTLRLGTPLEDDMRDLVPGDTLSGGMGDDFYDVLYIGSSIIELPGEGTDLVFARVDFTLPSNVENLTLTHIYRDAPIPNPIPDNRWAIRGIGNQLDNRITGNLADNVLLGMGGDDTIRGGGGNDTIDGGSGTDMAVYISRRSEVQVTLGPVITVSGPEGIDSLISIEQLRFADGTLKVTAGVAELSVARMYQAALGRNPELVGLRDWTVAKENGMSTVAMAQGFMGAPEFVQRYGNPDNAGFVTLLYQNVFGRLPDQAGFSGWLGALNSGALDRAQVVAAFADSAELIGLLAQRDGDGVFFT